MPLQIEDSALDQVASVLSAFEESKKHENSAKIADVIGIALDSTNKVVDSTIKILDQFYPKEKDSNLSKNHTENEARKGLVTTQAALTALSAVTGVYKSYQFYKAAKKAPTKGIVELTTELLGKQAPVDLPALKIALNKQASNKMIDEAKDNAKKAVEYAEKATEAADALAANNQTTSSTVSNIKNTITTAKTTIETINTATSSGSKTSPEATNAIAAIAAAIEKVNKAVNAAESAETAYTKEFAKLDAIRAENTKATANANTAQTDAGNLSTISDTAQIQTCLTASQNALKGSIKAEKDATAYKDAITKVNNAQRSAQAAVAETTEAKGNWDKAQ